MATILFLAATESDGKLAKPALEALGAAAELGGEKEYTRLGSRNTLLFFLRTNSAWSYCPAFYGGPPFNPLKCFFDCCPRER